MIKHYMPQGSYEWHKIRLGKLTGTGLKGIIGPRSDKLKVIYEMIAEEITGESADENGFINAKMMWGTEKEPIARFEYEKATGYSVDLYGFLQSEKWPLLGCSPDGLIGETGALEIKCPDTKAHVRYILDKGIPAEYTAQVLNYFLVNENLQWLDFMSYDPRFVVNRQFIKRVHRAELSAQIESATVILDEFFALHEAVKKRIIFGEPAPKYEPKYIVEPIKQNK